MSTLILRRGQTQQLQAIIRPTDHPDQSIIWGVVDSTIVSCSAMGLVTALSGGVTTVYAEAQDMCSLGKRGYYQIQVEEPVTGVTLNCSPGEVEVGKTIKLVATIHPTNAADKRILWASSDVTVATVTSDGTVTGKKAGTAIIGVQTVEGGFIAHCTVKVVEGLPQLTIGGSCSFNFANPWHYHLLVGDRNKRLNFHPAPAGVTVTGYSVRLLKNAGIVAQIAGQSGVQAIPWVALDALAVGEYTIECEITVAPGITSNTSAKLIYSNWGVWSRGQVPPLPRPPI